MKFCTWRKDGGQESKVEGFFLIEIKPLFSIVLLHFAPGSRDAYHSHAFGSVSWLLRGELDEMPLMSEKINIYQPSILPIWTPRSMFHKVVSIGHSWVLSFRGPWTSRWSEYVPATGRTQVLTHGRKPL